VYEKCKRSIQVIKTAFLIKNLQQSFLKMFNLFSNPEVTLAHGGLVSGMSMQSLDDRDFFAFRGIPYAKPPLGKLRFKVFCFTRRLKIENIQLKSGVYIQ